MTRMKAVPPRCPRWLGWYQDDACRNPHSHPVDKTRITCISHKERFSNRSITWCYAAWNLRAPSECTSNICTTWMHFERNAKRAQNTILSRQKEQTNWKDEDEDELNHNQFRKTKTKTNWWLLLLTNSKRRRRRQTYYLRKQFGMIHDQHDVPSIVPERHWKTKTN